MRQTNSATNEAPPDTLTPKILIPSSALIHRRANNEYPDIDVMPANTTGHDYVIGDIHGAKGAFDAALTQLRPNDRLFIVGDLMDRGEDSMGIMQTVMNDPRIHVVRGNHEESFLQAMAFINALKDRKSVPNPNDFINFIRKENGGKWISKTTIPDLKYPARKKDEPEQAYKDRIRKSVKAFCNAIRAERDKGNLQDIDTLNKFRDYIDKLPYIRVVGDITAANNNDNGDSVTAAAAATLSEAKKLFTVCHAAMPISDTELKDKINNKDFALSDDKKAVVTWSREKINGKDSTPSDDGKAVVTKRNARDIPDVGRNANSILNFCGHTVTLLEGVNAVRSETNAVNLDSGGFSSGVLTMVNVTTGIVIPCRSPNVINVYEARLDISEDLATKYKDYLTTLNTTFAAIQAHINPGSTPPRIEVVNSIFTDTRYFPSGQIKITIDSYQTYLADLKELLKSTERQLKKHMEEYPYPAELIDKKTALYETLQQCESKNLLFLMDMQIEKIKERTQNPMAKADCELKLAPYQIKSKKQMVFYPKPVPASKLTNFARGDEFESNAHIAFGEFFYEKLALDESKTRNFSLNEVFQAAYPDFKYAKASENKDTKDLMKELLNKQYDIFKFKSESPLLQLKAKLEYRQAIYQMRKDSDQQYKGIGFFQSAHKSVNYKLKAVEQMINEVTAEITALNNPVPTRPQNLLNSVIERKTPATPDEKKIAFARNDGELGILNKQLLSAVKQNSLRPTPTLETDETATDDFVATDAYSADSADSADSSPRQTPG